MLAIGIGHGHPGIPQGLQFFAVAAVELGHDAGADQGGHAAVHAGRDVVDVLDQVARLGAQRAGIGLVVGIGAGTRAAVAPAVFFWNNTWVLMAFTLLFVVTYVVAYLMIVRFKIPGWLKS